MAMYTMLRRATSAVVPLAARRAAVSSSSRTFHSALSVKLFLHKETTPFVPSRSFSNAVPKKPVADDNLLQTEIVRAIEDHAKQVEIPQEFPFQIVDDPEERTIQLKRQYEDESITVEVDIPRERTIQLGRQYTPLVVTVFKGNGVCLEFDVNVFPDTVAIVSLSIKKPDESKDEMEYERPKFTDLDENLQKAFLNYLEIWDIKPDMINFLQEYMVNKDNKDYLV